LYGEQGYKQKKGLGNFHGFRGDEERK
jgi:hypothetical protein